MVATIIYIYVQCMHNNAYMCNRVGVIQIISHSDYRMSKTITLNFVIPHMFHMLINLLSMV